MQHRDQPADEPFESRDLELGSALLSWAESHSVSLNLTVLGPIDAPGMDPTWLLRLGGKLIEAEAVLFYGPYVDIAVICPEGSEKELYIGGESDITVDRLVEMLDEVAAVDRGTALPGWLRRAPHNSPH